MKIDLSLEAGILEDFSEEKAKSRPVGVSFANLYDYLNKAEVATGYDFPSIIHRLKTDCMQAIGLVEDDSGSIDESVEKGEDGPEK